MTTRYIATVTYAEPRPHAVDGSMTTVAHAVVWTPGPEHMRGFGIAEGAVSITTAKETASHNIPALEPEAWKRLEARIAAMNASLR